MSELSRAQFEALEREELAESESKLSEDLRAAKHRISPLPDAVLEVMAQQAEALETRVAGPPARHRECHRENEKLRVRIAELEQQLKDAAATARAAEVHAAEQEAQRRALWSARLTIDEVGHEPDSKPPRSES